MRHVAWTTGVIGAAGAAALTFAVPFVGTDYAADAGPAVSALARGDLVAAAGAQAQMGPLSLLLRAPGEALLGGSALTQYRIGVLICLVAGLVLAIALARRRNDLATGLLVVAALVASPLAARAIYKGHPEEPLGAVLSVAALLVAARRPGLAGVLLGAALATKQWALIAVVPALVAAAPEARLRLAAVAGGVAAVFTLPFLLADPAAFIGALRKPTFGVSAMREGNIWSLLATDVRNVQIGNEIIAARSVPDWLKTTAHPAVAVLTLAGPAIWAARRRVDPFALLALAFLARCALDPWNHGYYHLPFVAALAGWEVSTRGRAPILAAASGAYVWMIFAEFEPLLSDLLYMAWAVPMMIWLATRVSPMAWATRLEASVRERLGARAVSGARPAGAAAPAGR